MGPAAVAAPLALACAAVVLMLASADDATDAPALAEAVAVASCTGDMAAAPDAAPLAEAFAGDT